MDTFLTFTVNTVVANDGVLCFATQRFN